MWNDEQISREWISFLNDVGNARRQLGCSRSGAWYRGVKKSDYELLPSIFRFGCNKDIDDDSLVSDLQKEVGVKKQQWKEQLEIKKSLKKNLQKHRDSKAYKEDMQITSSLYHQAVAKAKTTKQELSKTKRKLIQLFTPILGEREVFDEWVYQSGKLHSTSSWEILSEMRHYGVPTRLLDWTDQFEMALYFAVQRHRDELEGIEWQSIIHEEMNKKIRHLPTPCIWVLNPYKLSKKGSGRRSIWDMTREEQYDYYKILLVDRSWPLDMPVPIYAPGQNERMRAQGGFFTVFGNEQSPLEKQNVNYCLRKIIIRPRVAFFILMYLDYYIGMTKFAVYRDLDTLGKQLHNKFSKMQELARSNRKNN